MIVIIVVYCCGFSCLLRKVVLVSVVIVGFRFSSMLKWCVDSWVRVIIFSEYGKVEFSMVIFSFSVSSVGESSVVFVCIVFIGMVSNVLIVIFQVIVLLLQVVLVC